MKIVKNHFTEVFYIGKTIGPYFPKKRAPRSYFPKVSGDPPTPRGVSMSLNEFGKPQNTVFLKPKTVAVEVKHTFGRC